MFIFFWNAVHFHHFMKKKHNRKQNILNIFELVYLVDGIVHGVRSLLIFTQYTQRHSTCWYFLAIEFSDSSF